MNKIIKSALAFLMAAITIGFSACSVKGGDQGSDGTDVSASVEQSGSNQGGEEKESGSQAGDENGSQSGSQGEEDSGENQEPDPEVPQSPIFPELKEDEPEATPKNVGQVELISELKSTQYRSAVQNTEMGLTTANQVGADARAFSRVLYPAPIGGVKTYKAVDYGVSPNGGNNTLAFNALLRDLKDVAGVKMIVLEKGTYTFNTTIMVDGVKDLYIVGDDTQFVYSTWCTAIDVKNAENIHLNGISIDYNPSAVVAGTIKSYDTNAKTITISLYDEFSLSEARYANGKIKYGSYMEFTDDGNGNLYPNPNGNLLYNSTGDQVENITGGSYNAGANELTLTFKNMKAAMVGSPVSVAFTMYEHAAVNVEKSKGFYMEGCNLYSTCGMGIKLDSVENTYLNRTNLMLKAGSKRLMTATADGLHAKDCFGDLQLTGSIFENSHDDCINIASFYKNIESVSRKDRTITCTATSTQTNYPFEKGDVLEVYDPATFELCGTYKVTAAERSALTTIVTVDKKVTDELVGKIIGNVTRSPKAKISDCIFRNKRNRGILLQTRNSEITGNTFQNILHGPIMVHAARDIFAEAIVPRNVTISNNKFINNNQGYGTEGDIAVFTSGVSGDATGIINNITVTNNFCYGSARLGVYFNSCGDSIIANNLLCYVNRVTGADYSMWVRNSSNVTISQNYILHDGGLQIYRHDNSTINDNNNILNVLGGL